MKPFVKWAGGKTRLLKDIEQRLPADFDEWENVAYVEPFVGGGAVLCHMLEHHNNITRVIINDINDVLIEAYRFIQDNPGPIISGLKEMESIYNALSYEEQKQMYYTSRKAFNDMDIIDGQKIILFLFLNQTCFNGLYRENIKGEFNVPHSRFRIHPILNESNLWEIHDALQTVDILQGSFETVGRRLQREHVFFYLDPPYRPMVEKGNMFTMYDRTGFNDSHQERLKEMCDYINGRGWHFMLSNSDSLNADGQSYFDNLYNGYTINRIEVTRFINTYNAKQRRPKEVLITNYQPPQH